MECMISHTTLCFKRKDEGLEMHNVFFATRLFCRKRMTIDDSLEHAWIKVGVALMVLRITSNTLASCYQKLCWSETPLCLTLAE